MKSTKRCKPKKQVKLSSPLMVKTPTFRLYRFAKEYLSVYTVLEFDLRAPQKVTR